MKFLAAAIFLLTLGCHRNEPIAVEPEQVIFIYDKRAPDEVLVYDPAPEPDLAMSKLPHIDAKRDEPDAPLWPGFRWVHVELEDWLWIEPYTYVTTGTIIDELWLLSAGQ